MSTELTKATFEVIKTDFIKQSGLNAETFQKEVSFAVQHVRKNQALQGCSRESILMSVLNIAQVGLTLNPVSKYAYLVPRYNRKANQMECCLEPSYIGLVKLLTDASLVKSIQCNIIYEGDDVIVDLASAEKVIKHTPYLFTGKDKGRIIAAYSQATLSDGSKHVEIMSYKEIQDIREVSESYKAYKDGKVKSCVWVDHEGEMVRKTVIKRHFKYLPKSGGDEKLESAIELDNNINGFRERITHNDIDYTNELIRTSSFDEDKKCLYERELASMEYRDQVYPMMDMLRDNQVDRIDAGTNYNAGDIQKKLEKSVK